jgi:hypothetical protein
MLFDEIRDAGQRMNRPINACRPFWQTRRVTLPFGSLKRIHLAIGNGGWSDSLFHGYSDFSAKAGASGR